MAAKRRVLSPKAMAELLKPARLEIYESLQVAGPAPIAEIAARLGRPADALYYHVRKLVEIGVIEAREEAAAQASASRAAAKARGKSAGRKGAVYGVVSEHVTMDLDVGSARSRATWADGVAAILRLAERDVRAALEAGDVRSGGARRNLYTRRFKARLNDKALKRVNALCDELEQIFCEHAHSTRGRLFASTSILTPLEERTR